MIEATILVGSSIELALILVIWFRLTRLENHLDILTKEAARLKNQEDGAISELVNEIKDEMVEVIGNMRPPTAIDHLAGMWGQIMMMREQVKMVKAGVIPNDEPQHFHEEFS